MLVAEGELADRIRRHDWASTALGAWETWSPNLRSTVELMLATHAEIVLFCGREFVALYNDAYAPTIGEKHPRALGRPARENWAELWDDLGPLLRGVVETGKTFAAKDRPFYIERRGFGETVYFDISYSPVRDGDGAVEAVLCIVAETTARVRAAQTLADNEERLRESERRFRALVSASSDAVYRMSPDWQEMRQLDGRSFLSSIDGPIVRWMDEYLFPEDWPAVQAAIDRAVEARDTFELEHRVRRNDGSAGWTFSRAIPIIDERGEITEWFGMATDVTQAKYARDQQRILNNELSHRIKNLFAMVQALSLQTLRPLQGHPETRALQQRIQALSGAHDILLRNNWTQAPCSHVIDAALDALGISDRVRTEGPKVEIGSKAALSMALLLHELGTNAIKYGALSMPAGSVALHWHIADDARFHLTWTEAGGPAIAAPPQQTGFGTRLLRTGLTGTGGVDLSYEPSGLTATMSAPLPEMRLTN